MNTADEKNCCEKSCVNSYVKNCVKNSVKKIIHIDADCFFAAVEIRENPQWAGLPLAVGGAASRRGVIATCNYEARRFGVHSAMSSAHALRLCPQLEITAPRMSLYREYSQVMHGIFSQFTDVIEPLSLDEAFLDVSESESFYGSATLIAQEVRRQVESTLGIQVSAGVAPVKFLAKIASDWRKPNGIFVIQPDAVAEFMPSLPVKKLPGVGPVTAKKLARYGIHACGDIHACGLEKLVRLFGAHGTKMYEMSRGIDDRIIARRSERKSVSVERTYEEDVLSVSELSPRLEELLVALQQRIQGSGIREKAYKAFVKLKFDDFTMTTMETMLGRSATGAMDTYTRLMGAAWQRHKRPVRLLGIGVRIRDDSPAQLDLPFEGEDR